MELNRISSLTLQHRAMSRDIVRHREEQPVHGPSETNYKREQDVAGLPLRSGASQPPVVENRTSELAESAARPPQIAH